MSAYNVILEISKEMRRRIFTALSTTPGENFNLTGGESSITLNAPAKDLPDTVAGSLFLYHIEVDGALRNQMPLPDRTRPDRSYKPPLPVSLSYMFVPLKTSDETNQSMLGRVIQTFHDTPTITELNGTPLGDSRGGSSPSLRVHHDVMPMDQLTNFWSALSYPFRLSIGLEVEVVAIDSGLPAIESPRVAEFARGTGQKVPT